MKYRSRTEIAAMILRAANSGATKTRIMYGAYLSYDQAKEYLSFLEEGSLLRHEDDVYRLTEKGLNFLRLCDEINGMTTLSKKTDRPIVITE